MSEEGKKKHWIGKWIAWTVLVFVFGIIPLVDGNVCTEVSSL